MSSSLLLAGTLAFTFPQWVRGVAGDLYVAPDGNYVGMLELGDGELLVLDDGFNGQGAWCGDLLTARGAKLYVCGTGLIAPRLGGVKVKLDGPGVHVDDVALWREM